MKPLHLPTTNLPPQVTWTAQAGSILTIGIANALKSAIRLAARLDRNDENSTTCMASTWLMLTNFWAIEIVPCNCQNAEIARFGHECASQNTLFQRFFFRQVFMKTVGAAELLQATRPALAHQGRTHRTLEKLIICRRDPV
jgi:hypothetical protein